MKDQKNIAYEKLKELADEADTATYAWSKNEKDTEWKQSVQAALRRIFGDNSTHLKAFNAVQYGPMMFSSNTPQRVFEERFMSGLKQAQAIMRSSVKEYEDYEMVQEPKHVEINKTKSDKRISGRSVFVVHGHDGEMKEGVARYLEKLDFKVTILHEQANAGKTIIEKFESNSDVAFAIILMSPDDIGSAKDKVGDQQQRARQNVVLELGYFMGRLGRNRVFPLVKGSIELPSDIHGLVYMPYDGDVWKMQILKELKKLDIEVDANKAF